MKKLGFILTVFNRPEYLKTCLDSLNRADLSSIDHAVIFDDASTGPMIDQLCLSFIEDKPKWVFIKETVNKGIKNSLLHGIDILIKECDIVVNLDGDAIVRRDFLLKIMSAKEKYPELIITGFNCNTLNKNGSVRHKVLFKESGVNFKKTVGGINMCVNREQYHKWMRPALLSDGNWDHKTCLASAEESLPIGCVESSVIQHIGIQSSMGHSEGGEPADVADDFVSQDAKNWMKDMFRDKLTSVTLVGVDCIDVDRLLLVADVACKEIDFGAVKILSSIPHADPRVHQIRHIGTKEDYSKFMLKELVQFIETEHILIIQHDGRLLNPEAWRYEWLNYDYIGAPWYFGDQDHPVGNGGFSLRSKKLHEITAADDAIQPMNEPGVNFHKEEDHVICRIFGDYLQRQYGIKFAPLEEAKLFSLEAWENPDPVYRGQFGVHGGGIQF